MAFYVGQEFSYAGVHYRVVQGNRCEGDMALEFRVEGWHRPAIAHTLILADFKGQVEENNYGPEGKIKRGQGRNFLLKRITDSMFGGWKDAAERTRKEAQKAKERRSAYIQGQLSGGV